MKGARLWRSSSVGDDGVGVGFESVVRGSGIAVDIVDEVWGGEGKLERELTRLWVVVL